MNILGVDIGGTKTAVCIGDEQGEIVRAERFPTETERGFDDWTERLGSVTDQVLQGAGLVLDQIDVIGISAPGPLSTKTGNLLAAPNMGRWGNAPILETLGVKFNRPVWMNNDANAAVLAEWLFGGHRGTANMIYLTMSTGLGAGIIANGTLLQGASDTAGEVGFHVLDIHGPISPCGHRGSFEAFCGGKNVADRIRKAVREEGVHTAILDHAGGDPDKIDFRCFIAAVREHDDYAYGLWNLYIERLAQGVGNLIMILNPEVIILGTIAIHTGEFLLDPLRLALADYVIPSALAACLITPSSLGERIGELSAIAAGIDGIRNQRTRVFGL